MRSRVIGKWRSIIEMLTEKIREWLNKLIEKSIPKKQQWSNLVEEYIIYEKFSGEPFIREFINQRTRNAMFNRYCIEIKNCDIEGASDDDTEEVGKVRLMRKRKLIDEATLIIKKGERNMIYWKFDK